MRDVVLQQRHQPTPRRPEALPLLQRHRAGAVGPADGGRQEAGQGRGSTGRAGRPEPPPLWQPPKDKRANERLLSSAPSKSKQEFALN